MQCLLQHFRAVGLGDIKLSWSVKKLPAAMPRASVIGSGLKPWESRLNKNWQHQINCLQFFFNLLDSPTQFAPNLCI